MNPETIQKVADVVKSLNLNLNGTLNSQTVEEIAKLVHPYITWYFVIDFAKSCVFAVCLCVCVVSVASAVKKIIDNMLENN